MKLTSALGALGASLGGSHELLAPSSREVSLLDAGAVEEFITRAAPQVAINAAAFTRVDDAEVEREAATAVNEAAPAAMAGAAQRLGARLVHVSTDYVFDGDQGAPYALADATSPHNV